MTSHPPALPKDRPAAPLPGRRTLSDHVLKALELLVADTVVEHPETRDSMAEWLAAVFDMRPLPLDVTGHCDSRGGRVDTRSARLDVYLVAVVPAPIHLVRVRARDLCDQDGRPIDARQFARDCLYQQGHGIPNDPSALL